MNYIKGDKYTWILPSCDTQSIAQIGSEFNLLFPVAHTMLSRGYTTKSAITEFLFSSFEDNVKNAALLKDAEKAIERILYAIEHQEKILIFGDYDVDGITSSALMLLSLLPLNASINFYLPHRMRDGYGLSKKIVERAAKNGYVLIITVDNGITALEPVARANELGLDVIITDHHRPQESLPEAYAIINPQQEDCLYPFKGFAGVGVTFKLMSLLYERLKKPLPAKAYELLLLGTIADVVPLQGENRFWVRECLQYVNQVESYSFKVLKQNTNITKPVLSARDIGFGIAPQINALGRLEDPRQGVAFLIGDQKNNVDEVGKILFELNQARKEIERSIFNEIVEQITQKKINLDAENVIMAWSTSWPTGVIGLVASRLVSAYGKPTLLFHLTNSGILKGSCRSIPAFNMFDALTECKDLLQTFGGHSMAAGLSLQQENMPTLKDRLERILNTQLTPFDLAQKISIDAYLSLAEVNQKLVSDLNHLEPFGHGNEEPTFCVYDVVLIQKPVLLKDAHVKCYIFADGVIKPVIFFNRPKLFPLLQEQGNEPIHMAVHVTKNYWQGKMNIELIGLDVAFP